MMIHLRIHLPVRLSAPRHGLPDDAPDQAARGQSLVELALALPVLFLIVVGAASMGLGMYQAHITSDAIQEPALRKMEMSNQVQAIAPGTLSSYINGSDVTGNLVRGSKVDTVRVVSSSPGTSIIVGIKQYRPLLPLVPGFQIRVTQAINSSLLQPAHQGASVIRPYGQPWMPLGTPTIPPWEGG